MAQQWIVYEEQEDFLDTEIKVENGLLIYEHVDLRRGTEYKRGPVIAFLPGKFEIVRLVSRTLEKQKTVKLNPRNPDDPILSTDVQFINVSPWRLSDSFEVVPAGAC